MRAFCVWESEGKFADGCGKCLRRDAVALPSLSCGGYDGESHGEKRSLVCVDAIGGFKHGALCLNARLYNVVMAGHVGSETE